MASAPANMEMTGVPTTGLKTALQKPVGDVTEGFAQLYFPSLDSPVRLRVLYFWNLYTAE